MTNSILIPLLHNAFLLLALAAVYDLLIIRQQHSIRKQVRQVLIGVSLGFLGILLIVTSVTLYPGIVFDTRSVLLSISGLFLGTVPTLIAMLMTAAYRLSLGGSAAWVGVSVIFATGTFGLLWRKYRRNPQSPIRSKELYIFGVLAHLIMLALMLLLPLETALSVLARVGGPVLLVYPLLTIAIGAILTDRQCRQEIALKLEKNEERLKIATSAGNIGIWDRDITLNRLVWDDRMYELYGVRKENFSEAYEAWSRCVHPDDLERAAMEVAAAEKGEKPFDTEFRIVRPDGEIRWVRAFGKVIRNAVDEPVRMIGINQDITDRKRAEEIVQKNEERFRALVETIPDLVWLKDPDGIFLACNQRFEALYGAPEEKIRGKTDYDFVSKDLADFFRRNDKKALENNRPTINNEWVTFASDGHQELLETIKTPMYDADGQLTGVLGIGRNITERIENEKRFQLLFESIDSGVAIYKPIEENRDFIFVDMNPAGLRYAKVDREDVVGRRLTEVFPGVEESGILGALRRVAESGEPEDFPLTQYKDERMEQWVENHVFKLASGQIVAVFDDITEKHNAEERLRESERKFSTLVSNLPGIAFRCKNDSDWTMEFISEGCEEITGYTTEELTNNRTVAYADLIFSEDRKTVWGQVQHALKRNEAYELEYRIVNKSGNIRWVWERGVGQESEQVLEGFISDITERKEAEQELERFNKLATGRELRMVELKKEINSLCDKLGRDPRYRINL